MNIEHHKESEHLKFIYQRMINVYGENPNYDYMKKFSEIINNLRSREDGFKEYLNFISKKRKDKQ